MTSTPADALRKALAVLAAPKELGWDTLLAAVTTLGEAQAVLDAVKLQIAGELETRSMVQGSENPVTQAGHVTATTLLAERWQVSVGTARQYCRVGEAIARRISLSGELLPARFPALAAAAVAGPLQEPPFENEVGAVGWVSVEQAAVIVRELTKVAPGCSFEDLEAGERALVEHAAALTVPELRTLAVHVRDRLDQDGIEPRELWQRRRRSLTITTTVDGMTRLEWLLDPESAGYVVTAINAAVTGQLRRVRFTDKTGSADRLEAWSENADRATDSHAVDTRAGETHAADAPAADTQVADTQAAERRAMAMQAGETRTLTQLRSDAALEVFRHIAGCQQTGMDGRAPVAVVVRIDLDALQTGVGAGQIDGVAAPVSAGTVRRMAADADIIPVVLGGHSEVLDLGRARRLFSKAQRIALAERDGGCAWPGCPHPPAYTEAHHIRWWNAHDGRTDLGNGVLLCSTHHHRVHDDGWTISVHENIPYFTPPGHVDPLRRPRPRPGGRVRLPIAA